MNAHVVSSLAASADLSENLIGPGPHDRQTKDRFRPSLATKCAGFPRCSNRALVAWSREQERTDPMPSAHIQALQEMLAHERGVLLPGAPNALAARVIADLGFKAVYLTGAGLTNMHLGLPDLGFMDLSQVVDHVMAIRGVIDLPLIVDADTGFGNAINVAHTVRTLEQAGASAIQIEDQHAPKRCGHFAGKELIPAGEMVGKVSAAVDARREGMVVIARTDACAVASFAERQRLVDKAAFDAMETRYAAGAPTS
jgi:2-methylisocitrate lyase-like PEP mutase family enzyme